MILVQFTSVLHTLATNFRKILRPYCFDLIKPRYRPISILIS